MIKEPCGQVIAEEKPDVMCLKHFNLANSYDVSYTLEARDYHEPLVVVIFGKDDINEDLCNG